MPAEKIILLTSGAGFISLNKVNAEEKVEAVIEEKEKGLEKEEVAEKVDTKEDLSSVTNKAVSNNAEKTEDEGEF